MNSITSLSSQQLRQAADIQERIESLQSELNKILGGEIPVPFFKEPRKKKRKMSARGLANIRAGVAKRMAAQGKAPAVKPKRKMSSAGREALSLAAKARWRKAKLQGKRTL